MTEYSPLHDTGDDGPCSKGPCCVDARELAHLAEVANEWLQSPPAAILERRDTLGATAMFLPDLKYDCFIYMLTQARSQTLDQLCGLLDISRGELMRVRSKYDVLEEACKWYMAGIFEDEAETGKRKMPASIMQMGLERVIGGMYEKNAENNLSEEDVMVIVRTIADAVRIRVASLQDLDEEVRLELVRGLSGDIVHAFTMRSSSE
jgi:hypothetical protein